MKGTDSILVYYAAIIMLVVSPLCYLSMRVPRVQLPLEKIEMYIKAHQTDGPIALQRSLRFIHLTPNPIQQPSPWSERSDLRGDGASFETYYRHKDDSAPIFKIFDGDDWHFVFESAKAESRDVHPQWGCIYRGDIEKAMIFFASFYSTQMTGSKNAAQNLRALVKLLNENPTITISSALVELVDSVLKANDADTAAELASKALHHPTLMSPEFFPLDHKLSILLPVGAPLLIPLFVTVKKRIWK